MVEWVGDHWGRTICHCLVVPLDWSLSVVIGQGGRREVKVGLVLIPTLSSAIFGRSFVFDHGQFGARCDANIGMKPKALPLEKM